MIRPFTIPSQSGLVGEILHISSYSVLKNHKPTMRKAAVSLKRGGHLLLRGPNGIGKSTLLKTIAGREVKDVGIHDTKGITIQSGVHIGYYRQDFSMLNFDESVYTSLMAAMAKKDEQRMRSVAAGFLITSESINSRIGDLSEGQKGLVAFARLVLEQPGLLILDEPTNHINFRHIPLIAEALNKFEGAMILVSHVPEFVAQIRIDEVLDLEK